jgi:hypothetical protein
VHLAPLAPFGSTPSSWSKTICRSPADPVKAAVARSAPEQLVGQEIARRHATCALPNLVLGTELTPSEGWCCSCRGQAAYGLHAWPRENDAHDAQIRACPILWAPVPTYLGRHRRLGPHLLHPRSHQLLGISCQLSSRLSRSSRPAAAPCDSHRLHRLLHGSVHRKAMVMAAAEPVSGPCCCPSSCQQQPQLEPCSGKRSRSASSRCWLLAHMHCTHGMLRAAHCCDAPDLPSCRRQCSVTRRLRRIPTTAHQQQHQVSTA